MPSRWNGCGGEDLALLGRDGGVALDQLRAHAAEGLDAEGQRGHVEQQDAFDVAAEHAALDGRAVSHAFVGVDTLEAVLAGELLDHFLHGRDTAGAADEQDLRQLGSGDARVAYGLTDRACGLLDQMRGQLVELRAGQGHVQMLRAGGVRRDIRQVDVRGGHAGKLNLGLLSQVVAAEAVVAGGGQNFDDAVADLQHRHVERAAAEVIDHDLLVGLLVQTVSQCGRGRLVDDALDVETRDLAGVLGGLALGVGEVGRDGDDRFRDGLAEVGFRVSLQLLQNHGADLLRGVVLAVDGDFIVGAHFALDGADGSVGVRDGLTLCDLADHTLAGLGERDDGRRGAMTFRVGDDDSLAAFHDGDAAVGGAKVDTDNFTHCNILLY